MDCREATDLLLQALTGTTPPDARRALRAHLAECETCRREAASLEETAALLRSVPEPRLSEGQWPEFMTALERRLEAERMRSWRRVVRWIRNPRHAWSTAVATSAAAVALGLALLGHAPAPVSMPQATQPLRPFMTQSMVDTMPAMTTSLSVWRAGFGDSEVSYDLTGSH